MTRRMKRRNLSCVVIPLVLMLLLASTYKVYSQGKDSLIHICKYPVADGHAYTLKYESLTSYKDPIRYVPIFSKDSSVFAFKRGKVVTVYLKENFVLIRTGCGKKYISYSNLQKIIVNVGDKVSQGQLIGFTKKSISNEYFRLNFKMNNGEKDISYEDQLKYLKRTCN